MSPGALIKRKARALARLARLSPAIFRALRAGWQNPPSYPKVLQVEHTTRCNLKCVMCVHGIGGGHPPRKDMDPGFFASILRQFKGDAAPPEYRGLHAVSLQGLGEPMLHRDLVSMLSSARDLGIPTFFISNMTMLTPKLAGDLVDSGVGSIMVSVDSADPGLFAEIRRGGGAGLLERIAGNIRLLQEEKARRGSRTPEIQASSLLIRQNIADAPRLVGWLRSLGVARIQFNFMDTSGIPENQVFSDGTRCRDASALDMPPEELVRLLERVKELDSPECRIEVPEDWGGVSQRFRGDAVQTCEDLWEKPYVTVDGIVTPCCYAADPALLPLGDLTRQSFHEIWFGPAYQRLRFQHLAGRSPAVCHACPQRVKTVAPNHLVGGGAKAGFTTRTAVFLGDDARRWRIRRVVSVPRPKKGDRQ